MSNIPKRSNNLSFTDASEMDQRLSPPLNPNMKVFVPRSRGMHKLTENKKPKRPRIKK